MDKKDMIFEQFDSIYAFQNALKRPVNDVFNGKRCASFDDDKSFTYSKSYEEADDLLLKGYKEVVEEVKTVLSGFQKEITVIKNKVKKDVRGFAPVVPAAIKGVPKSMYNNEKVIKHKKQQCVRIVYNLGCRGKTKATEIKDCGLAILKLCMLLDMNGIRTKLDVIPKMAIEGKYLVGCLVTIKEYKQPLNTLKVCYPIVHPSFFRRHGFRWTETVPNLKGDWYPGYGSSLMYQSDSVKQEVLEKLKITDLNSVYIDHGDIVANDYDVNKILENILKINLK